MGKSRQIQNHLRQCLDTIGEVFEKAEIGMSFASLYNIANKLFAKEKLDNGGWLSISDPAGINMGHTIPFIDSRGSLKSHDWPEIAGLISQSRIFVNAVEKTKIQPSMAFTIEPRLKNIKNDRLPTVFFHTIVQIKKDGQKELISDFDEIFKLSGMNYMLSS